MTPERWRQVQAMVEEALDLAPDQRSSFLAAESEGDDELLAEVEKLLLSYDQVSTFLEPADDPVDRAREDDDQEDRADTTPRSMPTRPLEAGDRVGQYRLRRRLGRGGMGDVFLAERADDEFRRQVAIKVVHREANLSGVLRRFKSERQILASLDHPNIARLLDGGSTDDGRPYLVMELVEGVPIDLYCDQHCLSVDERLRLFQKVCSALQYAHQNLVVHRDIKPSNILVTPDGVPKLLDFGIAKLLNPELFPYTVELTRTELRPMTPQYASPEQLRGQAITTASDVYSLGVLLYKLLTGRLPHFASGFAPGEMQRMLSSEEPSRPSLAVTEVAVEGDAAPHKTPEDVARVRNTLSQQLRRQLQGDLDNIVLMALRKEPHRRYGSVEQLADDLKRHLDGLPVRARPDTVGYRVRKFVGRNRVGASVGVVATLLLVGFAVAVSFQAREIGRERDLVALERDKAQRVADFMVELFEVADPSESRGNTITVREVLDRGADKILNELSDQPEIQSTLLMTIGRVYGSLGLFRRAGPLLHEALALRRDLYGERSLEVAECLVLVATQQGGLGSFDDAVELLQQSLEIRQSILGEMHPGIIESLLAIGETYRLQGDLEGGDAYVQRAIRIAESSEDLTLEQSAQTLYSLAAISYQDGDLLRAESFASRLVQDIRQGEPNHQYLHLDLHLLGVVRRDLGQLELAEEHLKESLGIRREYWPLDPVGIQTLVALSRVYRLQGDMASAQEQVTICEEEGELWLESIGNTKDKLRSLMALCLDEKAEVATALGDHATSLEATTAALELFEGVEPATFGAYDKDAWVRILLRAGRIEEARPIAESMLRMNWKSFDFIELCRRNGIEAE